MIVDVIYRDNGLLICDCCGAEILCNECGDMPERCPICGNELDYRDLEVKE